MVHGAHGMGHRVLFYAPSCAVKHTVANSCSSSPATCIGWWETAHGAHGMGHRVHQHVLSSTRSLTHAPRPWHHAGNVQRVPASDGGKRCTVPMGWAIVCNFVHHRERDSTRWLIHAPQLLSIQWWHFSFFCQAYYRGGRVLEGAVGGMAWGAGRGARRLARGSPSIFPS